MLALLEQDCASSGQANCSDKGFAATPAEHCGPFSIEEDKDQSDANIAGNLPPGSPKCHKMTASPEATAPIMEETCADSFLSETTAQAGHFGESPGAIDANQSFQTDGASRIAFNSPFVDETFSTPGVREHSRAGCATSFVSVAAADLARQHLEWVQELESVDQKQVDLMMTQWKLLRSQTGMLAQQLIDMRKEVDQIKQEQHKTTQHLEQQNLQSRELQHRLGAMLQQSVEETHMSMARMRTEVQKRASQDSEMRRRLQSLESWTSTTFPRFESEISELHSAVDVSVKQVTQLKDQLLQQVDDWKSGHGLVIEHSTKLHDRMRKGLRALMTAHETHRDEVQQAHKVLLERCEQQLESKLQEVRSQFDECLQKDGDGDLKNRLDELEALVDSTLERQAQGLRLKCEELDQRCKELETNSKWMGVTLNQEVTSRNAMVEVFEQMLKTEMAKVSSSVSDQIAVANLDSKETQKTVLDLLSKETFDRQEQARAINCDLASLGNGLGDRLGKLEGAWHGVRQDWRETQSTFRSMQGQLRVLEDGLESGLQGLRAEMQSSLREERLKQEVSGSGMVEQMQAWEDFHKHLRQFYMAHTALPPGHDRLRESEMNMARLAEMLRCSQDSDIKDLRVGEIPEILRDSLARDP